MGVEWVSFVVKGFAFPITAMSAIPGDHGDSFRSPDLFEWPGGSLTV
jgi:hypothetical protein